MPPDIATAAALGSRGLAGALLRHPQRLPGGLAHGRAAEHGARALLDAGADPDAAWVHPEYGPQSALYGAAGVAHEPRMTALLLEAGADPDDGESVYHAPRRPS